MKTYRYYKREFLNKPGHHSTGSILVYVEETTDEKTWAGDVEFALSDCSRQVHLTFGMDSPEDRENSIHKLDTILNVITQFKEAFLAECKIQELREEKLEALDKPTTD